MPVPSRLTLVTLSVADVEASAAFYERLGWTRSSRSVPGDIAFFVLRPGTVLALFGGLAEESGTTGTPGASALALNVDSPEDVARVMEEFRAAGATVRRPAATAEWGGTSGYVADPDGHLWEVAHNPGFPFDEHGAARLD